MIPLIALSVFALFAVICAVVIKSSRFDNLPLLSDEYPLLEDNNLKILLQNDPHKMGRSANMAFARIKITTKRIWIGQRFLFGRKIHLTALVYFHEYDIPRREDPWYKRGHAVFLATPNSHYIVTDKDPPEIHIPVAPKFGAYFNIGELVIRSAKYADVMAALSKILN